MRGITVPLRESLALKLLSAFIAVIISVLTAYTLFAVVRERDKVRSELVGTGEMLAGLLAENSRVGVFAENTNLLENAAAGIITQRHVVMAEIYSADFRPLYSVLKDPAVRFPGPAFEKISGRLASNASAVIMTETEGAFEFVRPVIIRRPSKAGEALYFDRRGGPTVLQRIGYATVLLEKETLRKETVDIILRNAVISLIFIMASVVLVYWKVRQTTLPLEKLTASVNALGLGNEVERVPVETTDEIGKLASAFNTMVDRRRQAEEAIRESERKYRTLFEESKDVVFIETPDGRIIDMNPAGVELFGRFSKEEVLALDVKRDLYRDPRDREVFKQIIERQGFVKDYEVKLRKKSGELLDAVITATAVRDETGGVVAYRGILRDVSAQRGLERQLLHAQKMEAVGRLTGGIAHDFNNILTAIVNYTYFLQAGIPENDPLRAYVDQIDAAADRAARLTSGLLTFSRKQIVHPTPIDLNHVIRRVGGFLSKLIGEDVELMTLLSPEDLVVTADSGQIEQVLMNFATNARDAMPEGGRLTISTRRTLIDEEFHKTHGFGAAGVYAEISVTDTGVGMDQETMKNIFEPFFTTKDVGKGTGLGLSICYGIVKQHGGYIAVDSTPGSGTTFTALFPLRQAEAAVIPQEAEAVKTVRGSETILVAEDDDDVRRIIQSVLHESGYTPITAVDGQDALEKFMHQKDSVDLLVLDVLMPKLSGKAAYDEIRKIRPDIKVLFISGYTANVVNQQGILDEELHFVSKPVSSNKLLRKIREILDSSPPSGAR
jgi:PAS domain S-box-containing protein